MRRLGEITRLAMRDYRRDWRVSWCFILSLAAILGPLLFVLGLKLGFVDGMVRELVSNPLNRELRATVARPLELPWFDRMRQRDDVAFVIPLVSDPQWTIVLTNPASHQRVEARPLATRRGDPLLGDALAAPRGSHQAVLTQAQARRLSVAPGGRIDALLTAPGAPATDAIRLGLEVVGIARTAPGGSATLFVSTILAEAFEGLRRGEAVPHLGWGGAPPGDHGAGHPGFRLYARSVDEVAALAELLQAEGIAVQSRAGEIERVRAIETLLSALFWFLALLGVTGFALALGAGLWANVDRKRRDLSVLRVVGFRTGEIVWFPVVQSLLTALSGWLLAALLYYLFSELVALFAAEIPSNELPVTLCLLGPEHLAATLAITVAASTLAALFAGVRAARIDPSQGLREI